MNPEERSPEERRPVHRKYVVLYHEEHCPDCSACTSEECEFREMYVMETTLREEVEASSHAYYLKVRA